MISPLTPNPSTMKLVKVLLSNGECRVGVLENSDVRFLELSQVENCRNLSDILHAPDPLGLAKFLVDQETEPVALDAVKLLAPIDHQEVWAAGVTYKRSQKARMEESDSAASHYDKVYSADRPELFYKANPARVAGPGDPV